MSMLDDYSLRLLAEIGIEVYVPRTAVAAPAVQSAAHQAHDKPQAGVAAGSSLPPAPAAGASTIRIVCSEARQGRLLDDLLRGLRMAGLDAAMADISRLEAVAAARGLLILGETLMRMLGAGIPAQRQNEMDWIISSEPAVLAGSAEAKRSLWGEIKRLSRAQAKHRAGG